MNEADISFQMKNNEETVFSAEKIWNQKIKDGNLKKVTEIPWEKVIELKHELDDSYIYITYTNIEGETSRLEVECKNKAEAKHMMDEAKIKLHVEACLDKILKMSVWESISFQIILSVGMLVIGGFFTGVMYFFSHYRQQAAIHAKAWIVGLYELAQTVGYMPPLILTFLLAGACLLWALVRMFLPLQKRVIQKI